MKIFNILLLLLPIYTFAQVAPIQRQSANVFSCSKESTHISHEKVKSINYQSKNQQTEVNVIEVLAGYDDIYELSLYLRDYAQSGLTDIFSEENYMLAINHFSDEVVLNIDSTLQNKDLRRYVSYIRAFDWHAYYRDDVSSSDSYLTILIEAFGKLNNNVVFWEQTQELEDNRWDIVLISDISNRRGEMWNDYLSIMKYRFGSGLNAVSSILFRGLNNGDESLYHAFYNDSSIINVLRDVIMKTPDVISTNYISILGLILNKYDQGYATGSSFNIDEYITMIDQLMSTFEYGTPQHMKLVSVLIDHSQYEFGTDFQVFKDQYYNDQFSSVYLFNNDEIEIHTSLEESKVNELYLALRESKANFFKLTKDTDIIDNDPNEIIKMYIFKSSEDYGNLGRMFFNIPTSNGGIYIENAGSLYTFNRESETLPLDMLLKHEYVHYLDGRYNIHGTYGELEFYDWSTGIYSWWVEGLANYVASASGEDGYYISEYSSSWIFNNEGNHFNLKESLRNSYSNGGALYAYSESAWGYLNNIMPEKIHEMFKLVSSNSTQSFWDLVNSIANDSSLEQGYVEYLNKITLDYENNIIGDPLLIEYALSDPEIALEELVNIINDNNLLEDYNHEVVYTQPYKFLRLSKSISYNEDLDNSIEYINKYLEDVTILFRQNTFEFSGFDIITAWVESIEYIGDDIKFNIAFEIPVNGTLNTAIDTDGDGIDDDTDTDDDNDGVLDTNDAFPLDATEDTDTDGDGIGNNADTDDDNDGTLDTADAFPLDATEDTDTDGDGTGNNADTDDDGDNQSDANEISCGSDPLDSADFSLDTDDDTIPNCIDTDDDNDGTLDTDDAFPLDENEDTDTDGDGTGDNTDQDIDGDGIDNEADVDINGDGINDNGIDSDGDGINDANDNEDGTLGLSDEISIVELKLYPNPSVDQINISGIKSNDIVVIYNIMGQIIHKVIASSDDTVLINVYNYTKGIYIAVITQDNKKSSIKFIKR
tara:strand:+ start:253 stop:3225 length:2973 start_codon:yes stop_codon:yes gene_type:complete